MNKLSLLGIVLVTVSFTFACHKKKVDPPTTTAASTDGVRLKFEHTWDDTLDFQMNHTYFNPETGDSVNFTTFKYYVSNIKLKKADGSWWVQPNSYFLVDLSTGTTADIGLDNVPYGEYTDVQYTLGVDSTRNVSGAQDGALSPSMNMFWSWNTGYIMLKAEGTSPNAAGGSFAFHLGGFTGANNIVTTQTFNFVGNALSVTGNGKCQIHMSTAPQKLWALVEGVSILPSINMPGSDAREMATGFHNAFEFEHIHE